MLAALRSVICWLTRRLLALRYRVRVSGDDRLRDLAGPVLVLPNHPAMIDPFLALSTLWPWLRCRPLIYTGRVRDPVLKPLARLFDAVGVPDLERAGAGARADVEAAVDAVVDGLRRGRAQAVWPSGNLSRDGSEHVGGAGAADDALRAVPTATVVLVRTRGLWGSRFSHAAGPPRIAPALARGALTLLANLVFLTPRRPVSVAVEVFGPGDRPQPWRGLINPWLERWYAADGGEAPTYVPYHALFGPRTFEFPGRTGAGGRARPGQPDTRRQARPAARRTGAGARHAAGLARAGQPRSRGAGGSGRSAVRPRGGRGADDGRAALGARRRRPGRRVGR
jgi:long-chain-fatty-acid--[acyl-carrier-protein] ligase